MWKPPEKIRFRSSIGHLPDPQEIADSKLFSPLDYQRLHLDNRSWLPAMVPWRATNDGAVTREVLDWYGRFARSKPAAIVVEATGIRDVPSGPLMRIGHERYIGGLRQLVERIGEESEGATRIFIQLIDFLSIRRRQKAEKYLERF
ncbi:MAG: NADH:flavin oxidoreductase, partial [bacterium]|nr:NADH:flavin oxidoreductase [bacterium]